MRLLLKLTIIILLTFLALYLVYILPEVETSLHSPLNIKAEERRIVNNWKYGESDDKKIHFAHCKSTNTQRLCKVDSAFSLVVRKVGKNERGSTIYINVIEECAATLVTWERDKLIAILQFDNENPFEVNYVAPADDPSDIYLTDFEKILTKLRTSKKLTVKVEFREVGWKIIEFNVRDFKL